MNFQFVFLWSDKLIWLLLVAVTVLGVISWKNPNLRIAWQRVGESRKGMAAATLLSVFILIGLVDSIHYRPKLESLDKNMPDVYAVEVFSLLDAIATPLRMRNEKTYSSPLATHSYAKESTEIRQADGSIVIHRDFPRLIYGGAHLGDTLEKHRADIQNRLIRAVYVAVILSAFLCLICGWRVSVKRHCSIHEAWRLIFSGRTTFAWNAVLITASVILLVIMPLLFLSAGYHVLGTDKIGEDVLYQALKSIRTALVIGLVTTLVSIPVGVLLGLVAGYFRGWVDDVIQYVYTVLNSIPAVLLMVAAVLMMQVVIDIHPDWFSTAAERADLRLMALCFILGMTSWTGLCRLLRGEALKLRELEYVQAAQSFGVSDVTIVLRHLMPNVMHLIIITLVMDFSSLVLFEAVLSYVGIGVDPTMISFGNMINNARMEMAREPMVWWSLAAAFFFMVALVLSANLFADTVRDAFDPRMRRLS